MKCDTCERRDKTFVSGCKVFTAKPKKCWAYTTDKDWEKKYMKASKEYAKSHV